MHFSQACNNRSPNSNEKDQLSSCQVSFAFIIRNRKSLCGINMYIEDKWISGERPT